MKKHINTIFIDSVIYFVTFTGALIFCQYLIYTEALKTTEIENVTEYINQVEDIEKLRKLTHVLAESNSEQVSFFNEIPYDVRLILAGLSLFSAASLFSAYKARKAFLTSSSSGTTKPRVAP